MNERLIYATDASSRKVRKKDRAYTEAIVVLAGGGRDNLPTRKTPHNVGASQEELMEVHMDDLDLTSDEKACLRMWFRQAIAAVEVQEATRAMLAEQELNNKTSSHQKFAARRPRRSRLATIVKQQMEMV